MPRIDPQQLLNCLSVLLAPNGGIKSCKEVNRLVQLMGKFSKKLVSKCIYVQILKSTKTELLGQFMADGGWALSHTWLQDGILSRNWPLVQELLELMLLCPVDVQRLKSNSAPKLVKGLSKEGGNEGVRILASKLVEQWLKIVKGETSSVAPIPRQDAIATVLKLEIPDVKQEHMDNDGIADEAEDMVDPLEIPSNHVPTDDTDSKERLAKAKSDGLVFKITVKDGKQVLAKVESSPKKEIDGDKAKIKTEPKLKSESVEVKKQMKEKVKKEIVAEKVEVKKIEKSKNDTVKEKSKSDDKERRSSKENKEIRDSKESTDEKESKESKDKEKRKESSSSKSSSSKHSSSSSRSSSHKSSRSSSDSKHKSSSSRDKRKDSEKDRERSSKSSSSSSKSKSSSSSSSNSSSKSSQSKEKRDSVDEKMSQSMKDKDTLSKVTAPSINKLGKIPKKPAADSETSTESVGSKKSSISIEVKKDTENRPKTVKTFNSQFRSHGLAEEAPPPPSRRGLQRPSSQPTAGASIPTSIPTKRTSPPPEKKETVVPEKKLKIDTSLAVEKPGIKLIPAKPKTPVLVESDMFMDAIFASQTTKKDSTRKRKRLPSQSTSETVKPEKVQSPDSKSVAPKFYQDTLESESKDDDKTEELKKKDENVEVTKEANVESADVEIKEENNSIEPKEVENVIVENKKPPGPGCGPNGPPGVLTILKRKGPKKQLRWRPQESLEEIHYFELDETERINVSRSSVDMSQLDRFNEREGEAFLIARKMNADDSMTEQIPWKPLMIVDDVPPHPQGSNSKEKKIQSDRELTCLRAIYFNRSMIPESPAEPDMEQYQITDATIIPLDDANGSPEGIKSFVNYPWPEPRGDLPNQTTGFDDQQAFGNFPSNFPFNNQPGWTHPNMPPAFNGPHNMVTMNAIQPDPMNNINMNVNMNPIPPFQQNPNFGPPTGIRNNFNNNFGNEGRDGRMHSGPPQNNPNWFRQNGPMGPQNNWRPPMGNNNNRSRPEWNPRNVCRAFAKGFCRIGEKCQWLHPGINCPPFN